MPQNFIGCDREQAFLMPPSLRDWLPVDHLAWFVLDAVGRLDLAAFYAAYRADGHGRAAYEPSMVASLDDVCALPYSSGTTGRSKGVRLTHRTLVAHVCQIGALAPIQAGDRVMWFLPMFHIFGFAIVTLGGLVKGATLVTLPGFEPRSFLRAIQDERINTVFVVPPIANFLATPHGPQSGAVAEPWPGTSYSPIAQPADSASRACSAARAVWRTDCQPAAARAHSARFPRRRSSASRLPRRQGKAIAGEMRGFRAEQGRRRRQSDICRSAKRGLRSLCKPSPTGDPPTVR